MRIPQRKTCESQLFSHLFGVGTVLTFPNIVFMKYERLGIKETYFIHICPQVSKKDAKIKNDFLLKLHRVRVKNSFYLKTQSRFNIATVLKLKRMGENYSSGHKAQFQQMDPWIDLRK